MSFSGTNISYQQTNKFSTIILNYLEGEENLKPFYAFRPDLDGIKQAIAARKKYTTHRPVLVNYLKQQYAGLPVADKVQSNIALLLEENTFTITTAHQPNIFTGHLYFIYKILHAIKLAEVLAKEFPADNFVPVYYMGSEDADLEELGEVTVNDKSYRWQTNQKGAVGRMKIDQSFIGLINEIEAQLSVEVHGPAIVDVVKNIYSIGKTIEEATLEFVYALFSDYGLVILLPDAAALKKEFNAITKRELQEAFSAKAVAATIEAFPAVYKVQAAGRDLNLFYLDADIRERIEKVNDRWTVLNTDISFSEEEILKELEEHPERFSPNVILRPVFQEVILPNIVFIGGGGEIAYWLELKSVFEAADVPYPVLVLRNSFLVADNQSLQNISKLGLTVNDFFLPLRDVMKKIVERSSSLQLALDEERRQLTALYATIKKAAASIDPTLANHTDALMKKAGDKLVQLEKKMLRAEKKKFDAEKRQVEKIKTKLFPKDGLQERVENIMPFYARHGKSFIDALYQHSLALEQQFRIVEERV